MRSGNYYTRVRRMVISREEERVLIGRDTWGLYNYSLC